VSPAPPSEKQDAGHSVPLEQATHALASNRLFSLLFATLDRAGVIGWEAAEDALRESGNSMKATSCLEYPDAPISFRKPWRIDRLVQAPTPKKEVDECWTC
jgi:hypothetical protein